jgi:hypothetical protein
VAPQQQQQQQLQQLQHGAPSPVSIEPPAVVPGASDADAAMAPATDTDSLLLTATKGGKSRKSARECRLRKKEYVGALEAKVIDLEARDAALRSELGAVRAQLVSLQSEHKSLLRETGRISS